MKEFRQFIAEGVYDPGIFKAAFMAGGPGSGKSFIIEQLIKQGFHRLGLRVVGSDVPLEYFLKKAGLGTDADTIASDAGQAIRNDIAKPVTKKKLDLLLDMRVGFVIDGTGKDYAKISNQATLFESLGYDTAMIFVNTDLETAMERNRTRPRSLKDDVVRTAWKEAQKNIGKYSNRFKQHMLIVDNSVGSDWQQGVQSVFKQLDRWASTPPTSGPAKQWIKQQLELKNRNK